MCGLIGYVPLKKAEANLDWIKLIMVYNTFRGTDSCGIYMNQEVRKGTGTEDDARKWLANNPVIYDDKCKDKTIIAHTRKATHGAKGQDQAHPFVFENEERSMYFVHNGTISNMHTLAKKYEVDIVGLTVDSQMLGKIIFEKGYDVLKYYDGAAALLWAYSDEPNTLYAFKGASKQWANSKVDEERPLFFTYTPTGAYFSSMREPLDAMLNQDGVIYTVTANRVSKFNNNQMSFVSDVIEREEANIYVPAVVYAPARTNVHQDYGRQSEMFSDTYNKQPIHAVRLNNNSDVYQECSYDRFQQRFCAGALYFLAGRYFTFPWPESGNVVNYGIDATKHACPSLGIDDYLLNGWRVMVNVNGFFNVISAKYNDDRPPQNSIKAYFYEGVMIDPDKVDRFINANQAANFKLLTKNPFEKIRQLSAYSLYPITFTYTESSKVKENQIIFFHKGKPVSSYKTYQPLLTNRRYTLTESGKMTGIATFMKDDRILYGAGPIVPFIPSIVTPPASNVTPSKIIYEFMILDDGTLIIRYEHGNEMMESNLLEEESFNGIADTTYFIEQNSSLPNSIETFTMEGKDILYNAMFDYVSGYVTMDEDGMDDYARNLLEEAKVSGLGVLAFMKKHHGIGFEEFISDAMIGAVAEVIHEAEDVNRELDEEEFEKEDFDDQEIAVTKLMEKYGTDVQRDKISFRNEQGNERL